MAGRKEYVELRKKELAKLIRQLDYEEHHINGSQAQNEKIERLRKEKREIEEDIQS